MLRPRSCVPVLVLLLLAAAIPSMADVRLPAILSDHLVLQRNESVTLWGWADPGESIKVTPGWEVEGIVKERITVTAGEDGRWSAKIRTPEAGGPYTLAIAGKNKITLNDILIGEVWICSGQSNMQWGLSQTDGAETAIREANYPSLRLFHLDRETSYEPKDDCRGTWRRCSPETVPGFSAVAYYFGRDLHRTLGVPVGLVHTSWGGTPAEAWTSLPVLEADPSYARILDRWNDAVTRRDQWAKARAEYPNRLEAWRRSLNDVEPGYAQGRAVWADPNLDESEWKEMALPGHIKDVGLDKFDGTVWFRRSVEIPEAWAGEDLVVELGPIDDLDITWFNGMRIGSHEGANSWTVPREYRIEGARVSAGRGVLTVRVHDTGGAGGLYGKPEQLRLRPAKGDGGDAVSLAGAWKVRVGVAQSDLPGRPSPPNPAYQRMPSMLYNAMIAPILPYRIRGAIWYQGEANAGQAYQYRTLFPDMIRCWREAWGQGDFPFYFVQLAPFRYGRTSISHELREAQFLTLAASPNTGMAVTLDIGNPRDIHPRNKKDVGERLALWAKAKTYGMTDLVYSGPLYRGMKVQGNRVRLSFDHTGSGLATRDGAAPSHFTIAGEDGRFHPADTTLDGDTVVVSSPEVSRPVAVRYAWTNDAEPNLMNREGLPATSFRTDDWEAVTKLAAEMRPRGYTIPVVDLDQETHRQVIVDKEAGQYLGHPTTALLEDGRTMIAVYPKGHGRGAIVMKRSTDGGLTWSERLPVPESWATSQEVPTIYRVVDPKGVKRLILFSGLYPNRMAISEDDGATWSGLEPIGDFGGIVSMSDLIHLHDGSYMATFHDDGRFLAKDRSPDNRMTVFKTISSDGGLTWSAPERITTRDDAGLCEAGFVRSPDGTTIAALLRENYRKYNSMILFSIDEGKTWSEPREMPAALTGDRHQLRYTPDGRILASFRDTTHVSPTKGDWVGWVGTWEDLVQGRAGQYRIRFKDNHQASDCAYPAIEMLPDGTFVVTTYGHWEPGQSPYILSVRFKIEELDAKAKSMQ